MPVEEKLERVRNVTENSVKHGALNYLIIKHSYKYNYIWYRATKKWVINPEMSDKSGNEWQFNKQKIEVNLI